MGILLTTDLLASEGIRVELTGFGEEAVGVKGKLEKVSGRTGDLGLVMRGVWKNVGTGEKGIVVD
jgi:hypothetical protein